MWLLSAAVAYGESGFLEDSNIQAGDGDADDNFGWSVAVSRDRIVVGARLDEAKGPSSGSAYVYEWDGTQWVETKLVPSDGSEFDEYGVSVAVSGDRLVVGARSKDGDGPDAGAAYIFEWDGAKWVETKLTASDATQFESFGSAVAVSGDRVVVGAYNDDDNGTDSGSAYIFEWDGVQWVEAAKLVGSGEDISDWFGNSVAISGDRVVVGAPRAEGFLGAVYVLDWDGAKWMETAKLVASDGAVNDDFGYSVALAGNRLIVGAPSDDDYQGSAYTFEWNGAKWVETKLLAVDGKESDQFGVEVALYGDRVVIGAPYHDDKGNDAGAAYIFEWDGVKWVETTKLVASDGEASDNFGSVAVSGERVVIGAPFDEGKGNASGSIYVFEVVVLGGVTTGIVPKKASCVNGETGEVVAGLLVGSGWDCLEVGLEVFRGDRMVQRVEGEARDSPIGGAVFGTSSGAARCLNLTTGQNVLIHLGEETSWDCTAAGLEAVAGDEVRLVVRGKAG